MRARTSATGIAEVICPAGALKSQPDATQVSTLQRTCAVADAKKGSNLPQGLMASANQRLGRNCGTLATAPQCAKALVKATSGTAANEGLDELRQLLNAGECLAANGGGPTTYGAANYHRAFWGTPATTGTFDIQFSGHRLACASPCKDGVLAQATPTCRG